MICFPLRLTPSEPLFFARFDLMNWKNYGIMIWHENAFNGILNALLQNTSVLGGYYENDEKGSDRHPCRPTVSDIF